MVLVLIDAKPSEPKTGSAWSWQKQLVGPVETLLHVRSSSQELRDSIELKMAVDYLAAQKVKVTVTPVPFLFSSESSAPRLVARIEMASAVTSRGVRYTSIRRILCPELYRKADLTRISTLF